jgi:bile acid:Na+ symporter, BASS family
MDDSLVTALLLPAALAVIMLSLGLELTPADFRRVLVAPRGVAIGLLNLVLISPALALGMAELFALGPALAVGLVLLGASPGGTMANMLTHLARGDTALSVTMTAISSLAAVLTVPLALELATRHFDAGALVGDVSMGGIVARVLLITVIPVATGMALARRWPALIAAARPRVKRAALVTFVLVVAGAVVAEHERALDHLGEVAAAALALNLAAMTVSFTASKLARIGDRQATAIALELGIHNAALAIAVGATLAPSLTIPAAVYSGFMFVTAGLFARLMHRRNGTARPATAGA